MTATPAVHTTPDGHPYLQFASVADFSSHYGYDESLAAINDLVRRTHLSLVKRKLKDAGEAGVDQDTLIGAVQSQRFGRRQRKAKAPSLRKRIAAVPKDKLSEILARIERGEL